MEGYHSPQVDVAVRLNTNESPEPPPAAWRDAFAAEVSRLDWHRYPDRSAAELRAAIAALHGVEPGQVFAANGSNEVLQTRLAGLRRGGPVRRDLRADLPAPQPHRPRHRHRGGGGRAGRRLLPRPRRGPPGRWRRPSRSSPSCARPTTRRAWSTPRTSCARSSTWPPASWSSTRPTASSRPGRRWRWSTTTARWSSPAPSPRRGRWPRRASATWWGRRGSWPSSTRWRCPTTWTRPSRSPGAWPCGSSTTWRSG